MSEYPECPICRYRLDEPVSESIDGPIKVRCPSCEHIYEYIREAGSFPLEDDFGVTVSIGVLGHRMATDSAALEGDLSLSRALLIGALCCCTIVIIIPVVLSLLLALFG